MDREERLEYLKDLNDSILLIRKSFLIDRNLFDILDTVYVKEGELPEGIGYHEWINKFKAVTDYADKKSWEELKAPTIISEEVGKVMQVRVKQQAARIEELEAKIEDMDMTSCSDCRSQWTDNAK